MVEQGIHKPLVGGSSPPAATMNEEAQPKRWRFESLFLSNTPSASFYKHLRLLSAPLFAATIEAFQPERTAFAPESAIWLSQITPADTRHSPRRPRTEFSGRTVPPLLPDDIILDQDGPGLGLSARKMQQAAKRREQLRPSSSSNRGSLSVNLHALKQHRRRFGGLGFQSEISGVTSKHLGTGLR